MRNSLILKNAGTVFLALFISFFATVFNSCVPKEDEPEPDEIHMTIDIGGVKSEMASFGFLLDPEGNTPRGLSIDFLGGTLAKAYSVEIRIPNYVKGKNQYLAEKGEVSITYQGDLSATSGGSSLEWKSEKGTVEITSITGEMIEGTVNATLGTPTIPSKVVILKNGVFKVKKF